VLFHSDAVQALGKVPLDVNAAKLDLASLTAHKLYGPKGCGALYVRRGRLDEHIAPLIHGGGHERGLRSGTLNVPGIVGFGKACEIARREMREEARRLAELRDRLKDKILSALDGVSINGGVEHRLPGNLNLAFAGVEAEAVLTGLHDVAVSSGSACSSDKLEPSYVLRALGLDEDAASSSIRFGLGRFTTLEEVDYAASRVVEVVAGLRELVPSHDIEARERSWEKAR